MKKSRHIERIKLPAIFSGTTPGAASDERSNAEAQFSAAKTANAAKKKRGRPAS